MMNIKNYSFNKHTDGLNKDMVSILPGASNSTTEETPSSLNLFT